MSENYFAMLIDCQHDMIGSSKLKRPSDYQNTLIKAQRQHTYVRMASAINKVWRNTEGNRGNWRRQMAARFFLAFPVDGQQGTAEQWSCQITWKSRQKDSMARRIIGLTGRPGVLDGWATGRGGALFLANG